MLFSHLSTKHHIVQLNIENIVHLIAHNGHKQQSQTSYMQNLIHIPLIP